MTKTLLLDNSVKSYAFAHGITVPVPGFGNRLFLIEASPAKSPYERWKQTQMECLPTIARLAREGTLRFYTYQELEVEAWRNPNGFPAQPFGNVFAGIEIASVESAIRRGHFHTDLVEHNKAESLIEFCKWLLDGRSARWAKAPSVLGKLTDFEKRNLQQIDRFKTLCRHIPEKQYGDGFHLWTGEVNSLSNFLTTDAKFTRTVSKLGKLKLPCSPISPSDLLDELGVRERDPLPFQYGRRYYLSGMPYD
jgi:hypothetical protein